jgi:hypothetical protein
VADTDWAGVGWADNMPIHVNLEGHESPIIHPAHFAIEAGIHMEDEIPSDQPALARIIHHAGCRNYTLVRPGRTRLMSNLSQILILCITYITDHHYSLPTKTTMGRRFPVFACLFRSEAIYKWTSGLLGPSWPRCSFVDILGWKTQRKRHN